MISKNLSDLKEFLESAEGEQSIERFVARLKAEQDFDNRWIEKFRIKFGGKPDNILVRLMEKYYSDRYINKEHKLGFQPRESLLWLVWGYARKYCKPCQDKKYLNTFTGEAFYIGSYVIQIMYGQGAILRIDQNPEKISI